MGCALQQHICAPHMTGRKIERSPGASARGFFVPCERDAAHTLARRHGRTFRGAVQTMRSRHDEMRTRSRVGLCDGGGHGAVRRVGRAGSRTAGGWRRSRPMQRSIGWIAGSRKIFPISPMLLTAVSRNEGRKDRAGHLLTRANSSARNCRAIWSSTALTMPVSSLSTKALATSTYSDTTTRAGTSLRWPSS